MHVSLVEEVDVPGERTGGEDSVLGVGRIAAKEIVSPARKKRPSAGVRMTGTGLWPTLMASGAESVVL